MHPIGLMFVTRRVNPRRYCLLVFASFLAATTLRSVPLAQKNPPVRPADANSPMLIWDIDLKFAKSVPRNFRTTDDQLKSTNREQLPATNGLAILRASGSGEFTADNLKLLLARTRGPITVFDLRQETHIFVNGLPVSWFATNDWANVGRSQAAIEADETARVQSLKPGSETAVRSGETIKKVGADSAPPQHVTIERANTERDIIEAAGAHYMCASRLQITHGRLMTRLIDSFSPSVRFRRIRGHIFIVKLVAGGRRLSWCSTTCCEMRPMYLSKILCAVRNCSGTTMMSSVPLSLEIGRRHIQMTVSRLSARFTIMLALTLTVACGFGANG